MYTKAKFRIEGTRDGLRLIIDRLKQVKITLDNTVELGIENIQGQEDFSYVTRVGDVEKPEPIDELVKTVHNVDTVQRMRALFTVQAIHSALQTAETISRLTAHSITALENIVHDKLPYNPNADSWGNIVILQEVQCTLGETLRKVHELRIQEAIQSYDNAMIVYKEKGATVDEVQKFKSAKDKKRVKLLRKMWDALISGSEASRSLSVQKKKLENLLHVLRWPWIENLETPVSLLQSIQSDLQQLHEQLVLEDSDDGLE